MFRVSADSLKSRERCPRMSVDLQATAPPVITCGDAIVDHTLRSIEQHLFVVSSLT